MRSWGLLTRRNSAVGVLLCLRFPRRQQPAPHSTLQGDNPLSRSVLPHFHPTHTTPSLLLLLVVCLWLVWLVWLCLSASLCVHSSPCLRVAVDVGCVGWRTYACSCAVHVPPVFVTSFFPHLFFPIAFCPPPHRSVPLLIGILQHSTPSSPPPHQFLFRTCVPLFLFGFCSLPLLRTLFWFKVHGLGVHSCSTPWSLLFAIDYSLFLLCGSKAA